MRKVECEEFERVLDDAMEDNKSLIDNNDLQGRKLETERRYLTLLKSLLRKSNGRKGQTHNTP